MIKPYFDRHLAQDLLLRDKLARPTRDSGLSPRLFPSQTAVLLLVKELFLLQCVCTSEHERQKKALSAEHMLNSSEYR